MIWLSRRLSVHGEVIVDLCDSGKIWAAAVSWSADPFFRLKLWVSSRLLRTRRTNLILSYVTARDAVADLPTHPSIVVANNYPSYLGDLEEFTGPPERIVIAADLAAVQNREGMNWFEAAVRSGELTLRIPVEIYGPTEPVHALPPNVEYRGWAPNIRSIYEGQTAVFAPTVRGAGIQNKYLEAVSAGRPVVIGKQPSEAIPSYTGTLPFESKTQLVKQLTLLQEFSSPIVRDETCLVSRDEAEWGAAVLSAVASRRRGQRSEFRG